MKPGKGALGAGSSGVIRSLQAVVQLFFKSRRTPRRWRTFPKRFTLLVEEALQDEVGYGVIALCLAHTRRQAAASAQYDQSAAAVCFTELK